MPGSGTTAVHGADGEGSADPPKGPPPDGPVSPALDRSSTWRYAALEDLEAAARGERGGFYGRYGNENYARVERLHAALHGAEAACLFSSGMAALAGALLGLLRRGDRLVAQRQVYGGTRALLAECAGRLGFAVEPFDVDRPAALPDLLAGARLLLVESPTNPLLRVLDLPALAAAARRAGALLVVDSTFQGPTQCRPLALGADLVVESATKSLGGHSDLLAGLVAGGAAPLEAVRRARRIFGAIADPQTAWLLERSLKTLPLRAERQAETALTLARRLEADPRVRAVSHPGLASHPDHARAADLARQSGGDGGLGLVAFRARSATAARELAAGVRRFSHAPSLGGVESLLCLPAFTSHALLTPAERAAEGIGPDLVRLSVGLEDAEDLWADLDQALGPA